MTEVFLHQAQKDLLLESVKEALTKQPDFNLSDAFKVLDVTGKGWLTLGELLQAL
jgi:Ca2+-binding EF-hand superfamily protein